MVGLDACRQRNAPDEAAVDPLAGDRAAVVGLHALQVLPLLAALLAQRSAPEPMRTRIVWSVAVGYLGVVLLLLWQAFRAQPVFAPDPLTLGALGVVVLAALAVLVPHTRVQAR